MELTEKQKDRIKEKIRNTPLIKSLREKSLKNKEKDRCWASNEIEKLKIDRDALLLSGTMLYWAEGYNSNKNGSVVFTNTDSEMIKMIMLFFREIFLVDKLKMKVMVRIGEKGNIGRAEKYWSKITDLPISSFQKTEILKLQDNSKSLERYPNGICRLSVYDVTVRRKIGNCIQLIKDRISPRSSTGQSLRFLNLR